MDPATLIASAVITAATNVGTGVISEATKDGYEALMKLLKRVFEGNALGSTALAEVEKNPRGWETPLQKAIVEVGADRDQRILEAAQQLMDALKIQQSTIAKNNVHIAGKVQGAIFGDGATQTNYFTDNS